MKLTSRNIRSGANMSIDAFYVQYFFFLFLRKIKNKKKEQRKLKLYTEKFYLEEFIRLGYRRKLYQSQAVLCENRLWKGKQRTEITMYEWEMKNKGALVVPWGDA